MTTRIGSYLVLLGVLGAGTARADVKIQERTQTKFEGVIGAMAGMFGGKAAKEPVLSTVAVRGDRKVTLGEFTGEIIDLAEEKVYRLDPKSKTYKVVTFAQIRKEMEEAKARAAQAAPKPAEDATAAEPGQDRNVEVDFDVKQTGQARAINGFDTSESILTVAVRQKGKTLEQGGGLVMRSDMWLTPSIAGHKEIADFDRRYMQKLHGGVDVAASAMAVGQMAGLAAMNPGMGQAMAKMRAEGEKLQGSPVLSTMTIETVKSPEQQQQAAQSSDAGSGLSGILARKMAKKTGGGENQGPRSVLMTTTQEVVSVSPTVTDADVALPAGYREN
jgi:hypothetical protein